MEIKVLTARTFGGHFNDQRVPFIFATRDAFCLNCHAPNVETLSPADFDGCATGAFLCYRCSLNLPNLDSRLELRVTWPATITAADIEDLWASARLAKAKQGRPSLSDRLKASLIEASYAVYAGKVA